MRGCSCRHPWSKATASSSAPSSSTPRRWPTRCRTVMTLRGDVFTAFRAGPGMSGRHGGKGPFDPVQCRGGGASRRSGRAVLAPTPTLNTDSALQARRLCQPVRCARLCGHGETGLNFYDVRQQLSRLPYGDLQDQAQVFARRLFAAGIWPGDRFVLIADTRPAFCSPSSPPICRPRAGAAPDAVGLGVGRELIERRRRQSAAARRQR